MIKTNRITGETIETVRVQSAVGQEVAAELLLLSHRSGHTIVEDSTKQVLILYHQKSCTNLKGHTIAIVTTSNNRTILFQTSTSVQVTPSWSTSNNQPIRSDHRHCREQGCISCGILLSGTGARGVSSEHMENMEMFSCSPT